jgi:dihydroorotase-like cyclic amidohydrolase
MGGFRFLLLHIHGTPDPRFPLFSLLAQYVREERALPLMDALRKMTLTPAQTLERVLAMRDNGRLRAGADADIAVFDPATVRDASTYTESALQFFKRVPPPPRPKETSDKRGGRSLPQMS